MHSGPSHSELCPIGNVGIDFMHGCGVSPTSDFHCDFIRNLEVVGQGGEAVPEAMDSDIRKPIRAANLFDGAPKAVLMYLQHRAGWFPVTARRLQQSHILPFLPP